MGVIAIVLALCALVLLVAAEWPRLGGRVGLSVPARRPRKRRKSNLTVIEGGDSDDDFARSVERDLENLPVLEDRDDRTRR